MAHEYGIVVERGSGLKAGVRVVGDLPDPMTNTEAELLNDALELVLSTQLETSVVLRFRQK